MGHLVILTLISRHPHRIHVSLYFLGYSHVKHFSWDKYLEETNSLPAPARAFKVVREFALSPWFVCSMMLLVRGHLGNWSAGVAMRRSRRLKEMLSELFSFENSELFLWFLYMWTHMCSGGRHRGGWRRTLNVIPQRLSILVFEKRCLTDLKLAKWV